MKAWFFASNRMILTSVVWQAALKARMEETALMIF